MSDPILVSPEFADDVLLVAVAQGESTIALGSNNASVLAVQKALVILEAKIKPDGDFGPRTRAALVAFQAAEGLPESGNIDADTLSVLDQRLEERRKKSLHDAMAHAVGVNPNRPAPRPAAPVRVMTPTDSRFFTDASELPTVGPAATDDPDFPPPDIDSTSAPSAPLGSDRQTMFARVRDAIGDDAPAISALERLFVAGRFHSGKLLPNLATMAKTGRHPELVLQGGVDSDLLLRQVLRHVDNPLRVRQGVGRGTCGAGVIEYLLLRRDASEFVRLADGITGFSGQATLRSRRTITLPRTAIARDETMRVDIDRLFQSTIMNHATAMSWLFDYDNDKDDESFWSAVQGNTQMPIWGFASIYEDVMGERRTSVSIASRPKSEIAEMVVAESLNGDRVPVILRFNSFHWLSVERIVRGSDGRVSAVVLRNPWGWDPGEGQPPRVPLPEGGGLIQMQYGDLVDVIVGAIFKT